MGIQSHERGSRSISELLTQPKNNWKTRLIDVRPISMQMIPLANFLLMEFEHWFGSSLVASIIMA